MSDKEQQQKETAAEVTNEHRDLEMERYLLAYLLKVDFVHDLDVNMFTIVPHKFIYNICAELKETIPIELLQGKLKSKIKKDKLDTYFSMLKNLYKISVKGATETSIQIAVEALEALRIKRERLILADRFVSSVLEDSDEDIIKTLTSLNILNHKTSSVHSGDYAEDFEQREKIIEERREQEGVVGVPTGITNFDLLTSGIYPKEGGLIIGESSMGKSMFLGSFAGAAYDAGEDVFVGSWEMSKYEIQFRLDSRYAEIEGDKFRKGLLTEKEMRRWKRTVKKLRKERKNKLHIERFNRDDGVEELRIAMERWQDRSKRKIKLLVVDYLNIIGGGKRAFKSAHDWTSQADIAWGLKALFEDFNGGEGVAFWSANQVTDEAYGSKKLSLTNLKYGRAIAEVFPVIVGLVRTDQDRLLKQMQLQLLKGRNFKKESGNDHIIVRPNFDLAQVDYTPTFGKKSLRHK